MPMSQTLADRIREVFTESDLSYESFGKKLGVTKAAVCKWVNGNVKDLRGDHLFAFEDVFNISARWLVLGQGAKYRNKVAEEKIAYEIRSKVEQGQLIDLSDLDETAKNILTATASALKARQQP